jgi:hypothetical protein
VYPPYGLGAESVSSEIALSPLSLPVVGYLDNLHVHWIEYQSLACSTHLADVFVGLVYLEYSAMPPQDLPKGQ